MRISMPEFPKRVLLILGIMIACFEANAINTSSEEQTCATLGFTPRTEKHGKCVLELLERKRKSAPEQRINPQSNAINIDVDAQQRREQEQAELERKRQLDEYMRRQQEEARQRGLQREQEEAARQRQEAERQEALTRRNEERIEAARRQWNARCEFEKRNAYNQYITAKRNDCNGGSRTLQALCGYGVLSNAREYADSAHGSCMSGFPY